MPPRTVRLIVGAAVFLAFVFVTVFPLRADADDVAASCLDCAMDDLGFVDVDNSEGIVTAVMKFDYVNGERNTITVYVPPQTYKSFYLERGRWYWKAVWVDPILYGVHDWDWGWVKVAPGGRAKISLDPHGRPR